MNTRGSEWRKWDLHFHTPSSYDYQNKSVSDQTIIDTLIINNIEVVAITDHHIIDTVRIRNLQKLGSGRISILPGIEFRSELGGSESIHFIGIFSEKANIEDIWIKLQSGCGITTADIAQKGGDKNIHCDLKDTSALIHQLGGLVSVHAGDKTNTIENITNSLSFKMALKTDLVINHIDILELGKKEDQTDYNGKVFPAIKTVLPMILCSDNHNINDYVLKDNCWIKADPTFDGLKQIIFEPTERVCIQTNNPFLDYQRPFFSELSIQDKFIIFENQNLEFDKSTIPLNPSLVSIIGGRGEGKSILMDYFAKGFGYSQTNYVPSSNFNVKYSKSFNGESLEYTLENRHNLAFLYIKQNEVKDLALDALKLGNEIKRMLNLDSLESFDIEVQSSIAKELEKFSDLKVWFEQTNANGTKINNAEVVDSAIKRNQDLLESITNESNKEKLEKYTSNVKVIKQSELRSTKLNEIEKELDEFSVRINLIIEEIKEEIPAINFSAQKERINEILATVTKEIETCHADNSKIKDEFSEIYKGDLSSLLENADKYKRNIEGLKAHLEKIEKKQVELDLQIIVRNNLCDIILKELNKQVDLINSSWANLLAGKPEWSSEQKGIIRKILTDKSISIEGKIFFDTKTFYQKLRECINGRYWRNKNKDGELENYFAITDHISFANFLKNRYSDIETNSENYIFPDIEKFFFDSSKRVDYLYVQPEITFRGKKLNQISVGQRGTVYLCLKLATDTFSTPILFDQPEDDLDNQFITDELIEIFRGLKKFRQVIIITHNANLVVNTDAEQVIIAQNENEVLSYLSGALENSEIVQKVCNILEGGEKAFENRRHKYQLKN